MTTSIDSSAARTTSYSSGADTHDQIGRPERARHAASGTHNGEKSLRDLASLRETGSEAKATAGDTLEQLTRMISTLMDSLMTMISVLLGRQTTAEATTGANSGANEVPATSSARSASTATSPEPTTAASAGLNSSTDLPADESESQVGSPGATSARSSSEDAVATAQEPVTNTAAQSATDDTATSSTVDATSADLDSPLAEDEDIVSSESSESEGNVETGIATKKALNTAPSSGSVGTTNVDAVPSDDPKTDDPCTCHDSLQALTDDKGGVNILTPDGFTIKAEGKDQAWSIVGPEGHATRIWGDPHVNESDGDTWDFKDQSSFRFGENKATVKTVPAGDGVTFSSELTVYSGEERVTIEAINTNAPKITAFGRDGRQHDAATADGKVYDRKETVRGESWSTLVNGKRDVQGH